MPSRTHSPRTPGFRQELMAGVWMTVLLGALAWLSASRDAIFLVLPLGATLAILLYLPEAQIAKPRSVILGSVLGAVLGTALMAILGADASTAVVAALAAALVLSVFRVFHPPAIALALYPALVHPGWWFPLEVVLPFTLIAVLSAPLVRRRMSRQPGERTPTRHLGPLSEDLRRGWMFRPYLKVSKRIGLLPAEIPYGKPEPDRFRMH
jgi:CBS domain-containing membrane protein